jgi:hypothetical protein
MWNHEKFINLTRYIVIKYFGNIPLKWWIKITAIGKKLSIIVVSNKRYIEIRTKNVWKWKIF